MIVRLFRAWHPRIGWLPFLAVLMLGICFPSAIYVGHWVRGSGVLIGLGLAGGMFGNWLAGRHVRKTPAPSLSNTSQTSRSVRWLWAVGLLAGGVVSFVLVGEALPPIELLFQAYGSIEMPPAGPENVADQLYRITQTIGAVLWIYGREFAVRSTVFGTQIARWFQIVISGGVSRDNDIFLLWNGWLSWALAFHVAVIFVLGRHPSLALGPLGLAVTAIVALGRGGTEWLYIFLSLGTILWAYGTFLRRRRRWVRDQLDHSSEIGLDVTLAGMLVSFLAVTVSVAAAWGVPRAVTVLREPLSGPTQQVATTLDRLFGGVRRPPAGDGWTQVDFTDLPLTRVLAGPPELRDNPVLTVTLSTPDNSDVPSLYWRGLTYDRYTGWGWANSGNETTQRPPRPVQVTHLGPEIVQQVELLTDAGPMRYAAAHPVNVNVEATWITRDGDDLVGWYAESDKYTVTSQPTMASIPDLRSAPSDYPEWVVQRYLQLPDQLPQRVRDRAEATVGGAETAYDKAAAIEAAMRAITYSLEVKPPPTDQDVVDYFLFNMDAGYCDYFATTMTVLARAVGVPARLATGYATGTYDPDQKLYLVRGLDAHAWVEVYFPDIGWVPFEPTPAREILERAPAPLAPVAAGEGTQATGESAAWLERISASWPAILLIVLVGAGVLGLWVVGRRTRTAPPTPEDQVRSAYGAMWREAGWFGWDENSSQTPWERVMALQGALARRSVEVTLGGRHLIWRGVDVMEDLRQLGALFVKVQYSRQGVTSEEVRAARDAWRRIRWRLFLLCRDT